MDLAPIRMQLDKKMGNLKTRREKNKEMAQMRRRILQKKKRKEEYCDKRKGKVEMPI